MSLVAVLIFYLSPILVLSVAAALRVESVVFSVRHHPTSRERRNWPDGSRIGIDRTSPCYLRPASQSLRQRRFSLPDLLDSGTYTESFLTIFGYGRQVHSLSD